MLRKISPSNEERAQLGARFIIAQDSRPSEEALDLQATLRYGFLDLAPPLSAYASLAWYPRSVP